MTFDFVFRIREVEIIFGKTATMRDALVEKDGNCSKLC